MRNRLRALCLLGSILTGAALAAAANPYRGRQQRVDTFEFATKPTVEKKGDGFVIRFTSKAACDATVMILDKDGRIVRHLASGVLGKNAPAPFKQGTLEQELAWDGKDDRGRAVAEVSACKVKVGLGLTARLARVIGWAPGKANGREAFAVGPDGDLYMMDGGGGYAIACQPSSNVRVFDREGRYLRRILPPMSTVPPEKSGYLDWNRTTWGADVPRRQSAHYAIKLGRFEVGNQTPVVTKGGKLLWVDCKWRGAGHGRTSDTFLLMTDVRDGAMPPGSVVNIDPACKLMGVGALHMALSPDERWLYFGSPIHRSKVIAHAVFRMDLQKPGPVSVFLGDPKKPGKDNGHFNKPAGVACDKDGNLYVSDTGNGRIQVFKPDGTHLKTLPVKSPRLLAVNRKTGAIYVQHHTGQRNKMKLFKLGGLDDPAVKATWDDLSSMWENDWPGMAVDGGEERTVVWLRNYGGRLLRLEDRGDSFKKLPPNDVTRQAKGWGRWQPWAASGAIVADPTREEIYAREWSSCWPSGATRADGRTGKAIERIFASGRGGLIETMAACPNGDLFLRLFPDGTALTRYNPATKKLVPLKGAKPITRKGKPVTFRRGQPLVAIQFASEGGARSFQDQMGVAPNGDLYMPVGLHKSYYDDLEKMGQPMLWKKRKIHPQDANVLQVYGRDGTLKCLSALPGLGSSNGITIGRHGAVYITLQCQPVGVKLPDGLAPGSSYSGGTWATVVKFNSRFDQYPIGRIEGRWADAKPGDSPKQGALTGEATHVHGHGHHRKVRIRNMLWDYPGASPVRMGGCSCHRSTLSLDGFERVFVPAAQTCTVNVLDANGNIVVRIGGYGNADCRGNDSPVPDPKTGKLRPRREGDPEDLKSPLAVPDIAFVEPSYTAVTDEALYVLDRGNERILRAALVYHEMAEVELPEK
jgi:hypothetical protein